MIYESNINKVVASINSKLKDIGNLGELTRTVATYLRASNLRRIHNDGIAVSGREIGNYSTKPIYANPKISPRKFSGEGKTGKTKFDSGKSHKTRYFKTGYKGFRTYVGRETSVVNLQLSGKLKNDWTMQPDGKNYIIGFKSKYGKDVSAGMEKHFHKKIWGISKTDETQIRIIVTDFIKKKLAA